MDIVAESLSAKILKSREVLVNGQDIMDYIRSKLSVAVEFSGVYGSLEEANAAGANFNGSIVIVGSKEYIWSDKDNSWHQIGDETAVGQLIEYFNALSGEVDILSGDMNVLSGAISSKVYIGNLQTGENTDLSILKVTAAEYEQLIVDARGGNVDLSNNVMYIISSDNMNMYGGKILNLTMEEDSEPSEATNKHYVDSFHAKLIGNASDLSSASTIYGAKKYASDIVNSLNATDSISAGEFVVAVSQENGVISVQKAELTIPAGLSSYDATVANLSNDGYALSSTTTQVANELSDAISSKVYVGDLQTGEHTDLSVLKVTANEYEQLVADANSSGVDLSNNVIYIVSSDNMNMYGEKILNLTMSADSVQSEATNKHYVDSHLGYLSGEIDALSTYEQTKSQLSADGYATQSSIPSYNDISTNIHLSDYALKNELSTAADISAAISLSSYALSNDVSSKVDLENKFNQKLDATAAGKAFSPLSTYSLYEHVSYNGQLYQCSAMVSVAGEFQLSNWQLVDMTSPDATLDVTMQQQLRLVAADGTILWHQGYNLAVSSSTTLSIDAVNRYDFAWNATSAVNLAVPTAPYGKVGDFILDVTLTALAPFLSTTAYASGSHVLQDGACWTSTTSADAGSWDTVSANWAQDYVAWDSAVTYTSADNPVVKDNMLWKCVAESTTAGDWTQADWTTASFGLPQLENESIGVVVPENNNLVEMLTFAPGQMAELYFTQTSFSDSGQPTWKVVRQNVEEAGV